MRRGARQAVRTLSIMLCLLCSSTVGAQFETVHADLPLWTDDWEKMSPRHFSEDDGFGCASSVAFGDWRFDPKIDGKDEEQDADARWLRTSNYGAFHCYVVVSQAYSRDRLENSGFQYGHFVEVGKDGAGRRLFVLQIGGRPGSDYILLAHRPGEGIVASFDVLAVDCPKRFIRSAGNIDILGTTYCAISERTDFLAFVRAMAKKPPVGTLTLVKRDMGGKDDEDDD